MSHDHDIRPFPRNTIIVIGTVMLMTIMLAGVGRINHYTETTPTSPVVSSRELVFRDRPNGAVAVYDAKDKAQPFDVLPPESNYFLRATMRGLARQRLRADADREIPFLLTRYADGRLTLLDPTDGRQVEMEAFGIDNEKVFAALLPGQSGS